MRRLNRKRLPQFHFEKRDGIVLAYVTRGAENHTLRPPRSVKTRPITTATAPPITIQRVLSAGEPVKNLETSEENELEALIPKASKMAPPTRTAMAIDLFMLFFLFLVLAARRALE